MLAVSARTEFEAARDLEVAHARPCRWRVGVHPWWLAGPGGDWAAAGDGEGRVVADPDSGGSLMFAGRCALLVGLTPVWVQMNQKQDDLRADIDATRTDVR